MDIQRYVTYRYCDTPKKCDISLLWHAVATINRCFDTPLLWQAAAVIYHYYDISLLCHIATVPHCDCDTPLLSIRHLYSFRPRSWKRPPLYYWTWFAREFSIQVMTVVQVQRAPHFTGEYSLLQKVCQLPGLPFGVPYLRHRCACYLVCHSGYLRNRRANYLVCHSGLLLAIFSWGQNIVDCTSIDIQQIPVIAVSILLALKAIQFMYLFKVHWYLLQTQVSFYLPVYFTFWYGFTLGLFRSYISFILFFFKVPHLLLVCHFSSIWQFHFIIHDWKIRKYVWRK